MKLPPSIGAMRHRLVLEYPQRKPDGAGGATTVWLAVLDLWAKIEWRAGSERRDADGRKSSRTFEVIVRARPEIVPSRRFREGKRIYDILSIEPVADNQNYLVVHCEERNL